LCFLFFFFFLENGRIFRDNEFTVIKKGNKT